MSKLAILWDQLGSAESLITVAGLVPAGVLAQIVVRGDGLTPSAQLALVIGLVAVQLTAVILMHKRRDNDE